jgi:hypothetical protein
VVEEELTCIKRNNMAFKMKNPFNFKKGASDYYQNRPYSGGTESVWNYQERMRQNRRARREDIVELPTRSIQPIPTNTPTDLPIVNVNTIPTPTENTRNLNQMYVQTTPGHHGDPYEYRVRTNMTDDGQPIYDDAIVEYRKTGETDWTVSQNQVGRKAIIDLYDPNSGVEISGAEAGGYDLDTDTYINTDDGEDVYAF